MVGDTGNESLEHSKLQNVQEVAGRGGDDTARCGGKEERTQRASLEEGHLVHTLFLLKRSVQRPSVTLVCLLQSTFLWLPASC